MKQLEQRKTKITKQNFATSIYIILLGICGISNETI